MELQLELGLGKALTKKVKQTKNRKTFLNFGRQNETLHFCNQRLKQLHLEKNNCFTC